MLPSLPLQETDTHTHTRPSPYSLRTALGAPGRRDPGLLGQDLARLNLPGPGLPQDAAGRGAASERLGSVQKWGFPKIGDPN